MIYAVIATIEKRLKNPTAQFSFHQLNVLTVFLGAILDFVSEILKHYFNYQTIQLLGILFLEYTILKQFYSDGTFAELLSHMLQSIFTF